MEKLFLHVSSCRTQRPIHAFAYTSTRKGVILEPPPRDQPTVDSSDEKKGRSTRQRLRAFVGDNISGIDLFDQTCVVIDRPSARVESLTSSISFGKRAPRIVDALGVLGIVPLASGPFLVLITERQFLGSIRKNNVYRLSKVQFVALGTTISHMSERKRRDESKMVGLLESLLEDRFFYFSYTYDLTSSLQVQATTSEMQMETPLHQRATSHFWWNKRLLAAFRKENLHRWIVPVIRGFVHVGVVMVRGLGFDFILVSRRSRNRAGTRYLTRGVDAFGNVANYVETEQIVALENTWSSFVQTRGSVPLYWGQKASVSKYSPSARITPHSREEQVAAFQAHFDRQISDYGKQLIINLLDRKGDELVISEAYERFLSNYQTPDNRDDLDYVAFDFHAYCKNSQFENVNLLLDKVERRLSTIGIFKMRSATPESLQGGVVRTNCLDCLDRTNLVQSTLARHTLRIQLRSFGVMLMDYDDSEDHLLDQQFKAVWADNGDAISTQYAGTGALKSDFTRTGQRKTMGLMKDGINSVSRYVINTFKDGLRQITIDILLMNLQMESIDMEGLEAEEKRLQSFDNSKWEDVGDVLYFEGQSDEKS